MLDYIKKISWYIVSNKKRYILIVIFLMLANLLDIIPPQLLGRTIGLIYNGELTAAMTRNILLIFIGVIISTFVVRYWWGYLLFVGVFIIESILRSRLIRKFLLIFLGYYQ